MIESRGDKLAAGGHATPGVRLHRASANKRPAACNVLLELSSYHKVCWQTPK